jgi:NitT/TauT family transport system permease protein
VGKFAKRIAQSIEFGIMNRAGVYRIGICFGALGALEVACRLGFVSQDAMPPPTRMALGAWHVLQTPELRSQVIVTLQTVLFAFALSTLAGFVLGAALHQLPRLRRALDPILASYYAVPTFVFYPVFIVMFGLNRWPLVAIGFVFAVVAVAISTLDGLARVPRSLIRSAQVMHLGKLQTIFFIVIPAAAPWLFTAAKFGVAYSFLGVIAGEFVLADSGIGHAIAFAYNSFDNFTMYGLIVVLFVIVGGVNGVIWIWEQRLYARRIGN